MENFIGELQYEIEILKLANKSLQEKVDKYEEMKVIMESLIKSYKSLLDDKDKEIIKKEERIDKLEKRCRLAESYLCRIFISQKDYEKDFNKLY